MKTQILPDIEAKFSSYYMKTLFFWFLEMVGTESFEKDVTTAFMGFISHGSWSANMAWIYQTSEKTMVSHIDPASLHSIAVRLRKFQNDQASYLNKVHVNNDPYRSLM